MRTFRQQFSLLLVGRDAGYKESTAKLTVVGNTVGHKKTVRSALVHDGKQIIPAFGDHNFKLAN